MRVPFSISIFPSLSLSLSHTCFTIFGGDPCASLCTNFSTLSSKKFFRLLGAFPCQRSRGRANCRLSNDRPEFIEFRGNGEFAARNFAMQRVTRGINKSCAQRAHPMSLFLCHSRPRPAGCSPVRPSLSLCLCLFCRSSS